MSGIQGAPPYWLDPGVRPIRFPDVELAMTEPDGLLAAGGDLCSERLLHAYRRGIFPWYGPEQPILWWSPDPRMVLFPGNLCISRSLRRRIRSGCYRTTLNTTFPAVMRGCAGPRRGQIGTWITADMMHAYQTLHLQGHAHSVECWEDAELVGGLYGVAIGRVFFGESMFARRTDASKVAFVALVQQLARWQFAVIDCQVHTRHLASLGAQDIERRQFVRLLETYCDEPGADWCSASLDLDATFPGPAYD